jgi:hypothetical protein
MVARQLRRIELRKSVLVARSQGLRQEFATEIAPIRLWMNKAELGFRLARQGRDLLFILAPLLFATVKGEGGMMKRGDGAPFQLACAARRLGVLSCHAPHSTLKGEPRRLTKKCPPNSN